MSDRWLHSQSDEQAASRVEQFWSAMRDDLKASVFWADEIKKHRDEPGKRLQMAMDKLPLPAAFREAAVAIRAIIRKKRKAKEPYDNELGLLYWLAAIKSFMLPYADRLEEPGYNVVESIPGKQIWSLPVNYAELGYEQLGLLNKTDRKWLIEMCGEPQAHSTMNRVHRAVWDEYEDKLIRRRGQELAKSAAEFRDLFASVHGAPTRRIGRRSTGCLGSVLLLTMILLFAGYMTTLVIAGFQ